MDPSLCANGCGFFGSPENHNMCSKCYKDHILKLTRQFCESLSNITISPSSSDDQNLNTNDEHMNDESSKIGMNFWASASKSDEPKERKRCKNCNKKVGVTGGFMCRCGDLFCGKHRYPEEHSCTVDYKQIGRQLIQKQNPLCKADKLSRF